MTDISEFIARQPFVVAHRCGGGRWPEFSVRGVRGSVDLGVRALEVSVYTAATGEWVCSHDRSTVRATGVDLDIPTTPWAELRRLRSRADHTSDPGQDPTPLLLLTDLIEACPPNQLLFLDHKETSGGRGETDQEAVGREQRLLDFLDSIPGLAERVVWKVFAPAEESRRRAAERGYPSWGIHYSATLDQHIRDAKRFDLLGLEWDAPEPAWRAITALGRPVIGHIVASRQQGEVALGRGAAGLMASTPADFADLLPASGRGVSR
ncbi:glycerophosphodiester phosphodiesterase [Microlunatus parietis]|uniref:Glycerophosphoryl diester phosphodiesterase n=1 Tax=Microlunatus parietis TaxID=682979 RepID=A0A7Y9I2K1_9ACTN|nr:glycerophosphodiester phosphodiesterase family protein [Microlunatus parietis]NYE69056.1 glycerophosphoryl diester phosphodiesterase [Microlunatus parietis]